MKMCLSKISRTCPRTKKICKREENVGKKIRDFLLDPVSSIA